MNIFILTTGRCGSTTFIKACSHISNYTCGHETRSGLIGQERLNYPPGHIEADNRLAWFLGRLDERFGNEAFYVHLYRDREKTAQSFANRYRRGIMRAYEKGILTRPDKRREPLDLALDYCDTVTSNIRCFLKDKAKQMDFDLGNAQEHLDLFWERIGAQGDKQAALDEFTRTYNASQSWLEKTLSKFVSR